MTYFNKSAVDRIVLFIKVLPRDECLRRARARKPDSSAHDRVLLAGLPDDVFDQICKVTAVSDTHYTIYREIHAFFIVRLPLSIPKYFVDDTSEDHPEFADLYNKHHLADNV